MVNESPTRNDQLVDGIYPLGAAIRLSARSAVYETEISEGDGVVPAVIRIREVEAAAAEEFKARMRDAAELSHPNLLKIYAAGSATRNEVPVSFVVMERADESLEGVLAERSLTESETREMLAPVLEALEYLHKKGYAHSRLRPSNVLAVNDRLKLSADSAILVNDGEEAEDMRALGALIVQALGQETPGSQDLGDIVRHSARWTVEQVKARLNSADPIAVEEIPLVEEELQSSGVPKWIFAGLAAVMLIVVVAALMRNTHPTPVASTQAPARILPVPPVESHASTAAPTGASPIGAASSGVPQVSGRPDDRKASGWSVIVAAYGSRDAAGKRMREMAKKWPRFEISVSEPHGEKAAYLVVLGRDLSEDQAEALRKRAVGSGLPRDTYIKRLK